MTYLSVPHAAYCCCIHPLIGYFPNIFKRSKQVCVKCRPPIRTVKPFNITVLCRLAVFLLQFSKTLDLTHFHPSKSFTALIISLSLCLDLFILHSLNFKVNTLLNYQPSSFWRGLQATFIGMGSLQTAFARG